MNTTAEVDWNDECDVLVAGSGAGGVTGAYTAAREGLDVILVEATEMFGGTTAYSGGGGMWFPANPVLLRAGTDDTVEDALEYYTAVVGDRTPRALQETYVRSGAPLIEYLEADEKLKFSVLPWPDYFGKAPKARADGMRHIAAKPLKVAAAPDLKELIRGPLDSDRLGAPRPDDYFVGGRALIARFLTATQAVPGRLDPTEHRTGRTGGRGRPGRRRGRRGRAAPGRRSAPAAVCCWRPAASRTTTNFASRYGVPGESRDTMGPWGNQGLAHLAGIAAGADTDLMDQAWWSPGLTHPDGRSAFSLWFTGGIFVNHDGKRFVNESQAYDRLGREVVAALADGSVTLPYWMIYDDGGDGADTGCRRSRPPMCRWSNPRSTSRRGCGTPPTPWRNSPSNSACRRSNLVDTVARFNEFVARGVDDDFGRGDEPYDRAFSGGAPPLYAIEKAPFHAAAFGISDLGTKGGLRTDTAARVLDAAGHGDPRPVRGGQHDGRTERHRLSGRRQSDRHQHGVQPPGRERHARPLAYFDIDERHAP